MHFSKLCNNQIRVRQFSCTVESVLQMFHFGFFSSCQSIYYIVQKCLRENQRGWNEFLYAKIKLNIFYLKFFHFLFSLAKFFSIKLCQKCVIEFLQKNTFEYWMNLKLISNFYNWRFERRSNYIDYEILYQTNAHMK